MENDSINKKNAIPCKVILVGDSGVGKTSIVQRYLGRYQPNEKSTIGASYSNKTLMIEDTILGLDIWDTAGQERYRSVNSIFYRDANICVLVYDITRAESFESLKTYWYETVKEYGTEGVLYGIAGNKQDKFEDEKVNQQDVTEFATSIDAIFHLTSAKEGTSIDKLFLDLGQKFTETPYFMEIKNKQKNKKKLDVNETIKPTKKKKCCGN